MANNELKVARVVDVTPSSDKAKRKLLREVGPHTFNTINQTMDLMMWDGYAQHALAGLLAYHGVSMTAEDAAVHAHGYAAAMMAERSRRHGK